MSFYDHRRIAVLCLAIVSFIEIGFSNLGRAWGQAAKPGAGAPSPIYLDQGWSENLRKLYYTTPQGSHLIPLKFAKVLKTETGAGLFFETENFQRYGYLPLDKDPQFNPLGLPLGFVVDGYSQFGISGPVEQGERFVGVTCAACHTSQIGFKGQQIRIDGGPSLADFQGLMRDLDRSIFLTAEDAIRLKGFLADVAKDSPGVGDENSLLAEFMKFVEERRVWQTMNGMGGTDPGSSGPKFEWGRGRNDAFGVIFNQVVARDLKIPSNAGDPNAPVSYPVVWDGPKHNRVQWNGLANNENPGGPLARNTGEVLGVFGHLDLHGSSKLLPGYCSSARRRDLKLLEDWLAELQSPQWPVSVLGDIEFADPKRGALHGEVVYRANCIGCHAGINSRDPNRKIIANLIDGSVVGADSKMGHNAARLADSGILEGRKLRVVTGRTLEAKEPAGILLKHSVAGALLGGIKVLECKDSVNVDVEDVAETLAKITGRKVTADLSSIGRAFAVWVIGFWDPKAAELWSGAPGEPEDIPDKEMRLQTLTNDLLKLKARPLNGIWASAPYLHNGSVPNLYELLLPVDQRSARFAVGCSEFDPKKVGFDCGPAVVSEGITVLDTSIDGNRNSGHTWGTQLSEDDRWALIEYIKTL